MIPWVLACSVILDGTRLFAFSTIESRSLLAHVLAFRSAVIALLKDTKFRSNGYISS